MSCPGEFQTRLGVRVCPHLNLPARKTIYWGEAGVHCLREPITNFIFKEKAARTARTGQRVGACSTHLQDGGSASGAGWVSHQPRATPA